MSERVALCLIAAALALRIMVPAGWMPAEQGRWIELCTAQGSLTAFIDAGGERHSGDPADADKAKQHCAFAGLNFPFDPPAEVEAPMSPPRAAPAARHVALVSIGRGLAAPPPPATGPPAFA